MLQRRKKMYGIFIYMYISDQKLQVRIVDDDDDDYYYFIIIMSNEVSLKNKFLMEMEF